MRGCKICMNCLTRIRWNAMYKKYLEAHPDKHAESFIRRNKRIDRMLICLRKVEYV